MNLKGYIVLILIVLVSACKKDFLEAKSDKKLVIPTTLQDFQALLDNTDLMNTNMPNLGEIGTDDYYLKYETWNIISEPYEKNAYVWAKDVYQGSISFIDWTNRYQAVFYTNNVLEGLEKLDNQDDSQTYNAIKGGALFFRAYAFYRLAQIFCGPYISSTQNSGYGIPLRLKSDINAPSVRASIQETYSQILSDLNQAVVLLPKSTSIKTRPVKSTANALLSRVYLIMQDYHNALRTANTALEDSNSLMDYNSLSSSLSFPFQRYNGEVIFQSTTSYARALAPSRLIVDSTLYRSYADLDLRKTLFFTSNGVNKIFRGSYDGSSIYFCGFASDELYLNKAECLARLGQIEESMNVLDELLVTRWMTDPITKKSYYINQKANDQQDALNIILSERRKELIFRNVRWSDLRRLNINAQTSRSIYRKLNGKTYELKPNSKNYTLPIQDNVIQFSGIQQNPRD